MKILHYKSTIRLEEGGVVRAVLDLCGELARAGHDVTLGTFDPRDVPPAWPRGEPGTPRVLLVPSMHLPVGLRGRGPLAEAVATSDVVHLHSVWQPPNLQIARMARRLGKPYVASIHGMLDDWTIAQKHLKKRAFLALGGSKYLANASVVHATAEAELAQARKWIGGAPGEVAPLIFDLSQFRDLPGPGLALARFPRIRPDVPRLLFLSRLHPKKGVDRLVRAAAILRDRGLDFQLLLAGSGDPAYENELCELCEQLRLGDRTEFLGFVSGVEKVSLYQAATCFVLPTSQENFGFVFFEALACGCPVITTRGVDTWPEIEASGAGVIAGEDSESVAGAVESMLAEGMDSLGAWGERGRAWTLRYFDTERILAAYEAMYRRSLERAGRPSASELEET
jgi:glycosyltransferase involved in cell wall biosynthesis